MCQIILKPNTNRLRQLCRDHGTVWSSDNNPRLMPCFPGVKALTITSLDGTHTRHVPVDITHSITERNHLS